MPIDGDDVAALVYTSGTTGVSKGAMLTHNNFAVNGASLIQAWKITPADRFLLAPPLFHVHALGNGLHCWLMAACRMRLLERFDHTTAVAQFLDFQPTLFFGVPAMYVRLLDTPPAQAREIGQRMRLFVCGSAPLPAQILEEFRALFGHTILERYGMTETLMNMSNPYDGERRPGSVGLPLPGVIVKIVGPDGNPVADGETGELWLKGPNVFAGYWRREEATKAAFVDGWFRPAISASRSADGYYTLSGRKSDLIISGGFNIYPREIEEFLMEQPEVEEAAVVGRSRSRARRNPGGVHRLEKRQPAIPARSKPAAARSWRPSKSHAASNPSRSCRAMRWAKFRSTCYVANPDGDFGSRALREDGRAGRCSGRTAAGARETRRRSGGGDAALWQRPPRRRRANCGCDAAHGGPARLHRRDRSSGTRGRALFVRRLPAALRPRRHL